MSREWVLVAAVMLAIIAVAFIDGCATSKSPPKQGKAPNGFNQDTNVHVDWDSETLINEVNAARDDGPRRAALQAAILYRRITLSGFVRFIKITDQGGGYFLGNSERSRFEDCVYVSFDEENFDREVRINARIKVDGMVTKIDELGMIVSKCKLEEYERPSIFKLRNRKRSLISSNF